MIAVLKRPPAGVVLLAGVLLWACDRVQAPAEPEVAPRASAATSAMDLSRLARYVDGGPTLTIGFAAKTIGAEGGRIELVGFEAVVPPGAVTSATRFTIRLHVDTQLKDYVVAEFGPHGQTFLQPVTLRLPYEGTTAEGASARVLWWDGGTWVPFATSRTADGRIEARTDHFSEYGTEQRGITVSGG